MSTVLLHTMHNDATVSHKHIEPESQNNIMFNRYDKYVFIIVYIYIYFFFLNHESWSFVLIGALHMCFIGPHRSPLFVGRTHSLCTAVTCLVCCWHVTALLIRLDWAVCSFPIFCFLYKLGVKIMFARVLGAGNCLQWFYSHVIVVGVARSTSPTIHDHKKWYRLRRVMVPATTCTRDKWRWALDHTHRL